MSRLIKISTIFLIGVLLSLASLAVKTQYCMGGAGYGFPVAIIHPSHDDARFSINFDPEAKVHGRVLDFDNLFFNTTIWLIFVFISAGLMYSQREKTVIRVIISCLAAMFLTFLLLAVFLLIYRQFYP
jgi:hypothetical protein